MPVQGKAPTDQIGPACDVAAESGYPPNRTRSLKVRRELTVAVRPQHRTASDPAASVALLSATEAAACRRTSNLRRQKDKPVEPHYAEGSGM